MLRAATLALLALSSLFLGCNVSSTFLSDADRRSIYTVVFSTEAGKLSSGAIVLPGQRLHVSLSRMNGSASPEALALELLGSDGAALAVLGYATPRASKAPASAVSVESLGDSLPEFALPSKLEPGAYTMVVRLSDQFGVELQKSETVFFVGRPGFGLADLSIYPPSVSPGAAVLLAASVTKGEGSAGDDPWLRWTGDGRSFASGPLSKGFDKVVWRTPALAGAYSIKVDLYPTEPDALALAEVSPWRQELKAVVANPAYALADPFAKKEGLISHLAFEEDLADTGSRLQAEKPRVFGSPALDLFAGGFGYRLDAVSGVSLPGLLPPLKDGLPAAFSLLWRFYAEVQDGDLARILDHDGSLLLRVGLEEGRPFAEIQDAAGLHRSEASAVVAAGLRDIGLSFEPVEGRYALVWSIDGERYASASLPLRSFPEEAALSLGGSHALPAIYDEFAMSDDSAGPPALFLAAAQKVWKADLLLAEGFEATGLPSGSKAVGDLVYKPRSLGLPPKTSLSFQADLPLARPLALSLDYAALPDAAAQPEKGEPVLYAVLSADGQALIAVASTGEILSYEAASADAEAPTARVVGMLRTASEKELAFTLKYTVAGLEISPPGGLPAATIAMRQAPKLLRLSLENRSASGLLTLSELLVRSAPEMLSAADAPRMARVF